MAKIEVGILGATGMVGQQFVRLLESHPQFRLTWLAASERSSGKALARATEWRLDGRIPAYAAELPVSEPRPSGAPQLVFSAMDASVAGEIEREFAQAGHIVVSNSRNHRMDADVPLLIPEVNAEHLGLIPVQQRNRNWRGLIVTNPNCSTVVLTMALAPLVPFGIRSVVATTMQAVSGAGYPGNASFDVLGNVVPFISGEEDKMEHETQKILGRFSHDSVVPLNAAVSAHCNRVAVLDGHTVTTSVAFSRKADLADIAHAMETFQSPPETMNLPTAPKRPLILMHEPDRPQPRRDAARENGMPVFVGRVRRCGVLDVKFVACGHNTIRGAAGAAILNAELLVSQGHL